MLLTWDRYAVHPVARVNGRTRVFVPVAIPMPV